MGFRLHRSIKILPGLRMNFSKSGIGFSAGVKGYHVSSSPNGRSRRTISIPGTGMSWISYGSSKQSTNAAAAGRSTAAAPASPPRRPGLFARHSEKELYAAVSANDPAAVESIANSEHDVALAAATLAGVLWINHHRDEDALRDLQWAFDTGEDPGDDPFIEHYIPVEVHVEPVEGVTAHLPIDRTTVGLMLAELLQRKAETDQAITVVESLEPTTLTALSLVDLYDSAGRFDDVIEVTEGTPNVDDVTSLLWVFRGIAFREKQQYAAARECFAKVTRCRSRTPTVLHRARFERAKCYVAEGKKALARRELARIRAEDSDYAGLDAAIAQLDEAA